MSEAYEGKQIVGIDFASASVGDSADDRGGPAVETVRISNDPEYLRAVMARAGEAPEVVLEATYGWYWAADTLAELGTKVHFGALSSLARVPALIWMSSTGCSIHRGPEYSAQVMATMSNRAMTGLLFLHQIAVYGYCITGILRQLQLVDHINDVGPGARQDLRLKLVPVPFVNGMF